MKVATILLTKDNYYTGSAVSRPIYSLGTAALGTMWSLPKRPDFDKELLASLVTGRLVSEDGYNILPKSIQKLCMVYKDLDKDIIPITIPEIAKTELLIVVRSVEEFLVGKKFRLSNFKCLVKNKEIELWIRIR